MGTLYTHRKIGHKMFFRFYEQLHFDSLCTSLFCRSQVHQLHDFTIHHLMIPQTAKWRADDSDSRVADEIVGDEFAVAQKILAIFIINSVHTVLQR